MNEELRLKRNIRCRRTVRVLVVPKIEKINIALVVIASAAVKHDILLRRSCQYESRNRVNLHCGAKKHSYLGS